MVVISEVGNERRAEPQAVRGNCGVGAIADRRNFSYEIIFNFIAKIEGNFCFFTFRSRGDYGIIAGESDKCVGGDVADGDKIKFATHDENYSTQLIRGEFGAPLVEWYTECMVTLREAIAEAEKKGVALGHFNISTVDALWGIYDAARELNVPVIIGVSEGERSFIGVHQVKALVQSIRDEFHFPIFLNADHSYSLDKAKEAIDAGYDAVIFDGARLTLEENIAATKQVVEYARGVDGEVLVEGELGYIGESSSILNEIPEEVTKSVMTTPEDATRFVTETGVDLFAPAVGNIHGMLRDTKNPHLDITRIIAIRGASGAPLVLHGGSGTSDEDFVNAIKAGISIVHINTEIRKAWRDALGISIQEDPDTVAPYKILKNSREAVRKVVFERLKLFNKHN